MAFKFRWLCELLQDLEKNRATKSSSHARAVNPDIQVTVQWFNKYNDRIPRHGTQAVAFLSCMFPERRPDRTFLLQRKRLTATIARSIGLGSTRRKQLESWLVRDGADLPHCVEKMMAQAENAEVMPGQELTLEDLNADLDLIAARSPFSASPLRRKRETVDVNARLVDAVLDRLFIRLQSWEAKWLIRMLLRTYEPIIIPELVAMDHFHFLLRDLLNFQDSFEAAATILSQSEIMQLPARPSKDVQAALKQSFSHILIPRVGAMVRRPPHDKARSIKHCCQMAGNRHMSLERKYDGEYCQIHIDLGKGDDCIRIFSKSGKNPTMDRIKLHGAIRECLRLKQPECKIKQQCILEGELLVWNRRSQTIQPFHKIRKHVQRSGRPMGNLIDSPPSLGERLMIMFYDVLLLDEEILLKEAHNLRRQRLSTLIHTHEGQAEIGYRQNIKFSSRSAPNQLRNAFADAIKQGWEGFVLKCCDEAYISMNGSGRCIKLKKDYITGLGDTADFAIVGGSREARVEEALGLGQLSWTTFHIGCLENKAAVVRFSAKPVYRIVDTIGAQACIPKDDLLLMNENGKFLERTYMDVSEDMEIRIDGAVPRPTELFKYPFVAELCGSGFDVNSDTRHFVLRFPRLLKIHSDRPVTETVSFDELQALAARSLNATADPESQSDKTWIEKLEKADPRNKYVVDKSQSTTPGKHSASTRKATVSVTPNKRTRTKVRTPVTIRTDSSDISPTERLQRQPDRHPGSLDSRSPRQLTSSPLKRKAGVAALTTEASSWTKRSKIHEYPQTAPKHHRTDCNQAETAPRVQSSPCVAKSGSALRDTPPWCKWPVPTHTTPTGSSTPVLCQDSACFGRSPWMEPHLPAAKRPSPDSGEPLSEISNVSAERSRRRQLAATNSGWEADKAGQRVGLQSARSTTSFRKRLQDVVHKPAAELKEPAAATSILTVPTVSPLEGAADDDSAMGRLQLQPVINQHLKAFLKQNNGGGAQELPPIQQEPESEPVIAPQPSHKGIMVQQDLQLAEKRADTPLTFAKPIYIAVGVARNAPKDLKDSRGSRGIMGEEGTGWTTDDRAAFVDAIVDGSKEQPCLALIDSSQPQETATEMLALAGTLVKAKLELSGRGCVLFVDWRAGIRRLMDAVMFGVLKTHFGGALVWAEEGGGRGKKKVRAVWDLGEALRY